MAEALLDTCFDCGEPPTKLCDFHIGQAIGGYARDGKNLNSNIWRAVTTMKNIENGVAFYTCDRPLCNGCAKVVGRVIACGKQGLTYTFDRCKEHADIDDGDAPMISEAEAKALRARLLLKMVGAMDRTGADS